ncbi:protein RALF-like 24 isoform X1 [Momordica charantia]|uniref:Protein RALF-like 24 isoform X1 n=2 Tax=Momordica charantia TaxID=3673 RepID=A0A6J1D019_MOMCH|nr:protein RALF-like 24 isoform X1 [Momordica charantia]XP_022146990.1 protein RALF-like 24 isoform X1 [Momordica charantia]XP_022146991.1 protein RALF-like 24 isoform X1 [Momordica charantia]XP_022146992.1 protein RALF-like 24 isoform X1 [Momordica charantia]XP_022146993.1 protein RALF-like 24 isoform X1 [Momordica charantia]XP_022146994.1 protein RALF-like 24 isoform X1 [Momordica charantia]
MAKPSLLYLILILLAVVFQHTHFSFCDAILDLRSLKGSKIDVMAKGVCNQKIGECLTEPEMESETSRRVLMMQKKYISYDTLKRDMVPCTRPGVSYYECHSGPANSYDRGCEVITRCARDVHDINT